MILTLVIIWVVVSCVFFVSLAVAASRPIPPMEQQLNQSSNSVAIGSEDLREEEKPVLAGYCAAR